MVTIVNKMCNRKEKDVVETIEVFAARIKELKEQRGLGTRELAAELGISHSAISLYESRQRTPDSKKFRLF